MASENLELWSDSHPPRQRIEDRVNFAIETLKQYAPQHLVKGDCFGQR